MSAARAKGEPVIRLDKVTRILTDGPEPFTLVDDISFDVHAGEFLAITGPSGSGKSSLIYLMGLLDTPTSGRIWLDGTDTTDASDGEKGLMRLEKLGFVFQFHFLLPEFTALENIMLPMQKHGRLSEAEMRARAYALLAEFGLEEEGHKLPNQLSGGERQRVAIARAMANDPLVIIADEPTGNLDSRNSTLVFDLFGKLVREEGKAIITVTHEQDMAAKAQRRLHIVDGKLSSDDGGKPPRKRRRAA